MSDLSTNIVSQNWGRLDYQLAYEKQLACHQEVLSGQRLGFINLLEHPPTVTFGKHGKAENLLVQPEELERLGVCCVRSDRGGEVTAHMPGQLVIYPVLHLTRLGLGARAYVDLLLQATIGTLAAWGVDARVDAENPGVWVGQNKICAIGVRIKERVSLHGIAINVSNKLELFNMMIPCGIQQRGVISLQQLTGNAPDLALLGQQWLENFARLLGRSIDPQI
ncbi:MAG: lipoyl(octanoyl) transferase LipB [Oligoflexus sp.]